MDGLINRGEIEKRDRDRREGRREGERGGGRMDEAERDSS